jgi:hypothetical protein
MLRGRSSESTMPRYVKLRQRLEAATGNGLALDEVKVLGDEVLAVVHDEDAANVELDVVTLLLCLEKVERRASAKR